MLLFALRGEHRETEEVEKGGETRIEEKPRGSLRP
jgi:hypothetical protein